MDTPSIFHQLGLTQGWLPLSIFSRASRNQWEPLNASTLQEVALSAPPQTLPRISGLLSTAQAPSLAGRTEVE